MVLNPVRAGMVERPEEYRWSSFRATVGLDAAPAWLTTEWLLKQFSDDPRRAVARYAEFVDAGIGIERSPWDDLGGRIFVGTPDWIESIRARIEEAPRSEEHPRTQREVGRPTMEAIVAAVATAFETEERSVRTRAIPAARMLAAWLGWNEGRLRLREIRTAFRLRSNGTISDLIKRCARELDRDPLFRVAANTCRTLLCGAPPRAPAT